MEEVEVDAGDAIRLILQFLKENQLVNTLQSLQEESQISLNAVDSTEALQHDIHHGRWDNVLQQTAALECSAATMADLYELIVLEMMESQEFDVARHLLRESAPMRALRESQPERFARLDKLTKKMKVDASELYGGSTRQQHRERVAQQLLNEVTEVKPSRLLSMLGQALKWQQMQGLLSSGDYDLFRGASKELVTDRVDKLARKKAGKIKFSQSSLPQCAQFSLDGSALVSGTKDGFVEVWDADKCKHRKDLPYQAKDEFMMHDSGVTAMAFSRDGSLLATGSDDGKLKVWKLSSGLCLRTFDRAHTQSIHSVCFSKDGTQLLTASFDQLIRLHGLKSGQTLKEFRGHEGFVNCAVFSGDGEKVISSACDGTVKIWKTKTAECIRTIRSFDESLGVDVDIVSLSLVPNPTGEESIIMCTRSNAMYMSNFDGELLRTFRPSTVGENLGNFVGSTLSPHTKWLYAVTDKGYLVCFSIESGMVEFSTQVVRGDAFGVSHHPHRNVVATFGSDGYIRLWKA
ncbi:TPA: hypothetical protein N0F65_007860 [Lagenidium giganteum]|uniref:TPL/SMU1 LisH-like dimerisation domain-containing protein n=1 Tax=Lagenidium giganteum TaxID=4803 RepID=A0AAV2YJH5_9STRA|nr:TPA: hypothetical protein N0F65_007860 [Lagenidium giganteum]